MTFLERICEALNLAGVKYVVVGGHAVALHGAVRGTIDVDIALRWTKNNLLQTEAALQNLGLKSHLPLTAEDVYLYRDEYIRNRNLIAWNFYNPDNLAEQLDLIINYDAKGKRNIKKTIAGTAIPVLI
ncbi:MAG: hypothetical protein OER96_11520 [Gammaproteobacteria bacterium]|nr:hypothetical protein [Gammaproteobacteria bacterium]